MWIFILQRDPITKVNYSQMRTVYFLSNLFGGNLSASILESELLQNAFLTYNSIGKLVRFENENQSPYIAKSWHREGKTWIFHLWKGLECEDGEKITPSSFKKSIERTLYSQAQNNPVPIFEKLEGFESFKKGGELKGIVSDDDNFTLQFSFTHEMTSGVLEYLAMSPFGYICSSNFDNNGKWKDESRIISSGGYSLELNSGSNSFELFKRKNWPLNPDNAPDRIFGTSNADHVKDWESAIIINYEIPEEYKKSVEILKGFPMSLMAITLHSSGTGFFSQNLARKIFHKRFRNFQKLNKFESDEAIPTANFYSSQPYDIDQMLSEIEDVNISPPQRLNIKLIQPERSDMKMHAYDLIRKTLESLHWPFNIDTEPVESFSDFKSPKYDARVMIHEVGAGALAWGNEMLFCSKMGPEYPDPDGKVCQLTEEFNTGDISYEKFASRFSEIVAKQSAVIPILNRRYVWYIGNNIDRSTFSPLTNIPPFDILRFKQ